MSYKQLQGVLLGTRLVINWRRLDSRLSSSPWEWVTWSPPSSESCPATLRHRVLEYALQGMLLLHTVLPGPVSATRVGQFCLCAVFSDKVSRQASPWMTSFFELLTSPIPFVPVAGCTCGEKHLEMLKNPSTRAVRVFSSNHSVLS